MCGRYMEVFVTQFDNIYPGIGIRLHCQWPDAPEDLHPWLFWRSGSQLYDSLNDPIYLIGTLFDSVMA